MITYKVQRGSIFLKRLDEFVQIIHESGVMMKHNELSDIGQIRKIAFLSQHADGVQRVTFADWFNVLYLLSIFYVIVTLVFILEVIYAQKQRIKRSLHTLIG